MLSVVPNRGHNGYFCRVCGRHRNECGKLSARYKCAECGDERMVTNWNELREHSGPAFDHWRRRTLAAFGILAPTPEPGSSDRR